MTAVASPAPPRSVVRTRRRSGQFWLQLAFTLLVCAFLIVPVFMSILAGLTQNYFQGGRRERPHFRVGGEGVGASTRPSIARSASRSPASR